MRRVSPLRWDPSPPGPRELAGTWPIEQGQPQLMPSCRHARKAIFLKRAYARKALFGKRAHARTDKESWWDKLEFTIGLNNVNYNHSGETKCSVTTADSAVLCQCAPTSTGRITRNHQRKIWMAQLTRLLVLLLATRSTWNSTKNRTSGKYILSSILICREHHSVEIFSWCCYTSPIVP